MVRSFNATFIGDVLLRVAVLTGTRVVRGGRVTFRRFETTAIELSALSSLSSSSVCSSSSPSTSTSPFSKPARIEGDLVLVLVRCGFAEAAVETDFAILLYCLRGDRAAFVGLGTVRDRFFPARLGESNNSADKELFRGGDTSIGMGDLRLA